MILLPVERCRESRKISLLQPQESSSQTNQQCSSPMCSPTRDKCNLRNVTVHGQSNRTLWWIGEISVPQISSRHANRCPDRSQSYHECHHKNDSFHISTKQQSFQIERQWELNSRPHNDPIIERNKNRLECNWPGQQRNTMKIVRPQIFRDCVQFSETHHSMQL